jgi:hypothetical protein
MTDRSKTVGSAAILIVLPAFGAVPAAMPPASGNWCCLAQPEGQRVSEYQGPTP